jgi:ZIP family zinc transporter
VLLALLATLFTYGVTVAGASLVYFFKTINRRLLDFMLGFAAGVMIAASFWSLLEPSIALAESMGYVPWVPALIGFLLGAAFLILIDKLIPHLHTNTSEIPKSEIKSPKQRMILLVTAITIHNIPEGLAVGIAFGAINSGIPEAYIGAAIAVALGIGIQNFPEGTAVAVPLRREGMSRNKSFFYGQLSGIVEPIAGVLGAFAVLSIRSMLPYALAFAAGAMIFVVAEELIPEASHEGNGKLATYGVILGFAVMMFLDVALS